MGRVLGIDYGEKRVGVALSDEARTVAFPAAVFTNTDALVEALVEMGERERADLFVLGESDNPAGGENSITHRIAIFGKAIQVRSGKPVEYVSEAFTSAEARRPFSIKGKQGGTAPPVDAAAAALLLQTYLDRLPSHTHPKKPMEETPSTQENTITIDLVKRVEMRLGAIMSVERVPETDKLLRLAVDFGEAAPRQVVSGIAGYLADPQVLVGKTVPFVTNLEERTIRGIVSQAMIVACTTPEGAFSVLEPTMATLPPGTRLG